MSASLPHRDPAQRAVAAPSDVLISLAERANQVDRMVVEAARTGKIGDGKIFVLDVIEAIRIRNDDRGESVL